MGYSLRAAYCWGIPPAEHSHPIRRAVWLLDRLLDDPPAPPPPDVPELNQDEPDLAALSVRRQLELHRTKAACMNCHRNIDPWGVAFENYDAVGLWRETVSTPTTRKGKKTSVAVDAKTSLPDDTSIDGMVGLKRYLVEKKRDQFARAISAKVLTYALGRSLGPADEPVVERLTREFAENDYRLDKLIRSVVRSDAFLTK